MVFRTPLTLSMESHHGRQRLVRTRSLAREASYLAPNQDELAYRPAEETGEDITTAQLTPKKAGMEARAGKIMAGSSQ